MTVMTVVSVIGETYHQEGPVKTCQRHFPVTNTQLIINKRPSIETKIVLLHY